MRMLSWRAGVLGASLFVLSACGGGVETEPEPSEVRMSQEPVGADDVEALVGRGHGCPRQGGECRAYCRKAGHASGSCSGYGHGNCVCRDADSEQ